MSEPDDLDAIVTELNAGAPRARASNEQIARLHAWLGQVVEQSASDLLLVPGAAPSLRVDGLVVPLLEGPLGGEEIEDAVLPALALFREFRARFVCFVSFRAFRAFRD